MNNTILAFKASWCQPCKNMAPVLEVIDPTRLIQYDIDEHRDLVDKYEIRAVPTFVVLGSVGSEINRFLGQQPRSKFESYLG